MTLDEIGRKHGTDKSSLLSGYLDLYETYFPEPEKVKTILEIGLKCGESWKHGDSPYPSLLVWKEYFPNAMIFGADIKNIKSHDKGIVTFRCDQSRPAQLLALLKVLPALDLIIDDGSHAAWDQQITFSHFSQNLKIGGYYVIEDLQSKRPNPMKIPLSVEVLKNPGKVFIPNHYFGAEIRDYEINVYDCLTCKDNIAFMEKLR
jgi:hypothetical protein